MEEKRGLPLPGSFRQGPIAVPDHLRPFLLDGFNRLLDPGNRYVTAEHLSLMVADLMLRTEETIWQTGTIVDAPGIHGGAKEIALLQQYMKAHVGDVVKLEQLAQLVHWSPNYLCRIFKVHTGKAPMAYLQWLRMTEAEKLAALHQIFPFSQSRRCWATRMLPILPACSASIMAVLHPHIG